ncbi:hypothetical protein B0J14DRAFT_564025 [Halenospora varia]|nr:hypothetical protein B0J14DRAFT_564025 [Halenospora varia]
MSAMNVSAIIPIETVVMKPFTTQTATLMQQPTLTSIPTPSLSVSTLITIAGGGPSLTTSTFITVVESSPNQVTTTGTVTVSATRTTTRLGNKGATGTPASGVCPTCPGGNNPWLTSTVALISFAVIHAYDKRDKAAAEDNPEKGNDDGGSGPPGTLPVHENYKITFIDKEELERFNPKLKCTSRQRATIAGNSAMNTSNNQTPLPPGESRLAMVYNSTPVQAAKNKMVEIAVDRLKKIVRGKFVAAWGKHWEKND